MPDAYESEEYARAVCAYAAQQLEHGVCEDEVLAMLRDAVRDLDPAPPIVDAVPTPRWDPQRDGHGHIVTGALWCLSGLAGVAMMYGAVAPPGTYVLAGGALIFGALKVVQGLSER